MQFVAKNPKQVSDDEDGSVTVTANREGGGGGGSFVSKAETTKFTQESEEGEL